jgi:hypothetical protein
MEDESHAPLTRAAKRPLRPWTIPLAALVLFGVAFVAASRRWARPQLEPTAESDPVSASVAPCLEDRFPSWVLDDGRLTKGDNFAVHGEIMSDGGLRVEVRISLLFTGEDVSIEIHGTENVSLRATASVSSWSDESANRTWPLPRGTVLVNRCDWTHLLEPGSPPLILGFRLHDVGRPRVYGVVEIPKRGQGG